MLVLNLNNDVLEHKFYNTLPKSIPHTATFEPIDCTPLKLDRWVEYYITYIRPSNKNTIRWSELYEFFTNKTPFSSIPGITTIAIKHANLFLFKRTTNDIIYRLN